MNDYSKQLTHEHRKRYQTLDLLREWDRNLYNPHPETHQSSFVGSSASYMRIKGVYEQTCDIQALLAWVDTLRQHPTEKVLDGTALEPLIEETKRNLNLLKKSVLSYQADDQIQIKPMPMLRVLSEVYDCNLSSQGAKPKRMIDFLKTLHAALNEQSVKKELDHHQRSQRKALKTHITRVKADFQQYPCLLFVHLLLNRNPLYRQHKSRSEKNQQFVQWQKALIDECHKGREPVFSDLVRYYWRIIDDSSFGLRLWIIFAFVPTARTLSHSVAVTPEQRAGQIAQYWQETITQQEGVALTKRADDHAEKRCSQLGVVCREDQTAIARLQRLMYTLEALSCLGSLQQHSISNNGTGKNLSLRSQSNGAGPAAPISSKPESQSRSTVKPPPRFQST